jgi:hypothetical protein
VASVVSTVSVNGRPAILVAADSESFGGAAANAVVAGTIIAARTSSATESRRSA